MFEALHGVDSSIISLFILWENSKNTFSIFVFILMAGVFVSSRQTETHYWILFH